jgi:hypothetical protein
MNHHRTQSAEAQPAEQLPFHISRRSMATSIVAGTRTGNYVHSTVAPAMPPLPEPRRPNEPVPIWLAALLATPCEAKRGGEHHAVRWNWASGRALYTNAGRDAEHIEPLGVSLLGGHTMAVCWMPGETAYTVEVYRQAELCA